MKQLLLAEFFLTGVGVLRKVLNSLGPVYNVMVTYGLEKVASNLAFN